jgi:hypothetical protein
MVNENNASDRKKVQLEACGMSSAPTIPVVARQLEQLVAGPIDAAPAAAAVTRSLQVLNSLLQKQPNQRKVFLNVCAQLLGPLLACRSKYALVRNEAVRGLERMIDKVLGAVLFHEIHIQGRSKHD